MYSPTLSIYDDLKNGDYQAPSIYLAALKNRIANPDVETVRQRLQKVLQREDIAEIVLVEQNEDDDGIRIVLRAEDDDDSEDDEPTFFPFEIKFINDFDADEWSYETAEYRNRNLLEDERVEMYQTPQLIECVTYFNPHWGLTHWLVQLAVLDAVGGECYALQDLVASTFLSGTWLAEMAETHTPPSLECAYVMHAITPDDPENGTYWLHTHGLLKFGLPELEMLCVKQSQLSACQGILTTTATRLFAEPESWYQDETMLVAHNEQGDIAVHLLAWQDALQHNLFAAKKAGLFGLFAAKKDEGFSGDLSERTEGDIHTEPSMVILPDVDGKMAHWADLTEILNEDNHMMLLLPNMETARMYYLAAEKLPAFTRCFQRFAPEEGVWGYMMKIACTSPSTETTEHMWFMVQDLNDENVTAELVNQPFEIPELQAGESYTLPLEDVTDWCIYSSPLQMRIAPDDVYRLKRYLQAN
ncbi:DUF4026 domain-containing protein [Wielerella bovis]|uniref:DUF4026 domain-containing protein n=1 Tax=Wielerella bovis TaxID=2917790 RepID=UPI0020193788|nr:DUF4026 domain-containing protein [Wielerella bovis]ULJ64351.1 DUF4026 domain-containing protein [Wielerella bovis]ULJ66570.1 DUF4026 domain-containing protein [Wielerella bovis]